MPRVLQIWCGDVVLADGTNANGRVTDLAINGTRIIQECQPLRAEWMTFFGRGQRKNTVEFTVFTEAASPAAALQQAALANDSIPDQADFVLSYEDELGNTIELTLSGAAWGPAVSAKVKGWSNEIKYSAVGAQYTATFTAGSGEYEGVPMPITGIPFPGPSVTEASINPYTIPAGLTYKPAAGQLMVCRSLACYGVLDLTNGVACAIIGGS